MLSSGPGTPWVGSRGALRQAFAEAISGANGGHPRIELASLGQPALPIRAGTLPLGMQAWQFHQQAWGGKPVALYTGFKSPEACQTLGRKVLQSQENDQFPQGRAAREGAGRVTQ